MTRSHDLSQLTTAELELSRRQLRANLALIASGSPAHVPILAHEQAIDAEVAGHTGNQQPCVASEGPAGVEDVGRVERRFDRLVHGQRHGSELLPQPGLLEHPDAVLTGDGAAEQARVIAEPFTRRHGTGHGLGAQVRQHQHRMQVAVASVRGLPVTPALLIGGVHDTGHIRAAFGYLAAGRGVVFALPHMGNYDLAGAWVIAKGAGSVTTVAERVKPESVYGRFVAFREGLGVEVPPASGGTSSAFGVLAQRLRAGAWVVPGMVFLR